MHNLNLSLKLNYFKKKFKLTNQKIAELADLPIATVERISSGRTQNPNLKTLKALADIFKCKLDDLITLDNTSTIYNIDETTKNIVATVQNDNDIKTLFSIVINLNYDHKQAVIGLAQRLITLQ